MNRIDFKYARFALASLALAVVGTQAAAVPVVDQSFDTIGDTSFYGGLQSLTWQQTVTAGLTGTLSSVQVYFNDGNLAQGIRFFVNLGAAWQSDTNDFQNDITLVSGWNTVDVSAAGILLNAGEQFVIGLQGLGSGVIDPTFRGSSRGGYAAGAIYLNDAVVGTGIADLNFRTFIDAGAVPPVPEPGTALLLAGGLAGLACRSLRSRSASPTT
jgi:PEP-CTERM motif